MKVAETRAFAPLMVSDTSRNLRRVFKLSEMMKAQAPKEPRLQAAARARDRRRRRWAPTSPAGASPRGMEVSLQDVKRRADRQGHRGAEASCSRRKFKTKAQRAAAKARLIADPKGDNIGRADVVIEAIVEKLEVKQKPVQVDRGQAEARRRAGDQHLLDHDREHRRAAGRSRAASSASTSSIRWRRCRWSRSMRGRRAREEEVKQGLRLRRRHRQVPADRQERARASSSTACWRPT